ncbi:MAG: sulfurtransferase TusA family protein [Eubacteriales bacterium]|nr:sulfurtransferase TusA family protein [Eubacteriales bacterium]MDY3332796.1 sulfurtransferase TusA family protein [Gallibacter sp.]
MEKINVDTRGMDCPIPLIKLKEALSEAEDGQEIDLTFTCPEAVVNLPTYCQENGHEVIDFEKNPKEWRIVVKK